MGIKTKNTAKKIILTTDQYLIADGVQSIDDEFLEWFVKNTSCEEVDLDTFSMGDKVLYNVVFPQEELKQELIVPSGYYDEDSKDFEIASLVDFTDDEQESIEIMQEAKEMAKEQETLEEAAEKYSERHQDVSGNLGKYLVKAVFQDGAKWQQERSYSEEEVYNILVEHTIELLVQKQPCTLDEFFEKFKKKA